MPLQLLHVRGIFPAVVGLVCHREPSPASGSIGPGSLDRPCLVSPTRLTRWSLNGQTLSTVRGRLAHSMAEPTETNNWTINSYSLERIAEIVNEPFARAKEKELSLARGSYLRERITKIVSKPFARAKGKELGLARDSYSLERITEIISEPFTRAKGKELGLA
jgi:hypothetical protein